MFKIHYVGDVKFPIVEWDTSHPKFPLFVAWSDGRGVQFSRGLAFLGDYSERDDNSDIDAFLEFAEKHQLHQVKVSPTNTTEPGNYSPDSIVEFVKKNQGCTFTQIKNATGLSMGELGKALDGFVEDGTINRKKKGNQYFYST